MRPMEGLYEALERRGKIICGLRDQVSVFMGKRALIWRLLEGTERRYCLAIVGKAELHHEREVERANLQNEKCFQVAHMKGATQTMASAPYYTATFVTPLIPTSYHWTVSLENICQNASSTVIKVARDRWVFTPLCNWTCLPSLPLSFCFLKTCDFALFVEAEKGPSL